MINKAILIGRLTAHPELKKTPSGVSVTSFSVAVQRNYKDASGEYPTDFINVVAWRNTAEFITKFFTKGQAIGLVGSIQTRKYEDQDGNKRTVCEVVAEEASFVESKNSQSSNNSKPNDIPDGFEEIDDDETCPF